MNISLSEKEVLQKRERDCLEEIATLEQHVQHLNRELENMHSKLGQLKASNHQVVNTQNSIRHIADDLGRDNESYRNKVTTLLMENVNFEIKLGLF